MIPLHVHTFKHLCSHECAFLFVRDGGILFLNSMLYMVCLTICACQALDWFQFFSVVISFIGKDLTGIICAFWFFKDLFYI